MFHLKIMHIKNGCGIVAMGQKSENGLFVMKMFTQNPREPATVLILSTSNTLQIMHERMILQNKNQ